MFSKILKAGLMAPFFFSFAFAETIIVKPSAPPSKGNLLISGQVSKDIGAMRTKKVDGKTVVEDANLSRQSETYTVCLFKRSSSGAPIKLSMQNSYDCGTGDLNKTLALAPGSYYLTYNNTKTTVTIESGRTTRIELIKIQAPQVAGVSSVSLYVDYTNSSEQNKFLFNVRMSSENQDFVSSLPKYYWGRNYLMPFIDSGNYSDVDSHARDSFFNANGESCGVNVDGAVQECSRDEVGSWYPQGTRQNCVEQKKVHFRPFPFGTGFYTNVETNCNKQEVTYNWSRAYFLVLPGTYIMQWNGETTSEKSVTAR